jgi:hypothetical protein
MIQALPPAEISFHLEPAWRPWENRKPPVFRPFDPGNPAPPRFQHFELPREHRLVWIHPVVDFVIWLGLATQARSLPPWGSTWNNPQEILQYTRKTPYTEWKGSLIFRQ